MLAAQFVSGNAEQNVLENKPQVLISKEAKKHPHEVMAVEGSCFSSLSLRTLASTVWRRPPNSSQRCQEPYTRILAGRRYYRSGRPTSNHKKQSGAEQKVSRDRPRATGSSRQGESPR